MTWRRDERPENVRTFGDFKVFSETRKDGGVNETAHVVQFPDGREIRVKPDPEIGGRSRAAVVREAVAGLANTYKLLGGAEGVLRQDYDPALYLYGVLAHNGLEWENALEVSIEEWLANYIEEVWTLSDDPPTEYTDEARHFLKALEADGWTIERKGGG